jgi:alcohol dehydrogenase
VVADPGVVSAGLLDGILDSLKDSSLPYEVFDEVEPNATLSKILKGSEILREMNCDILLSVGGGSTIDTAKGIGCLATNPGPLPAYEGPEKYSTPPLPTIAVPTTAGTGAEISFGAVVFDEERNYKFSFRSALQAPKVALLDPLLLRSLPSRVAAFTGMDTLCHGVEAYVSRWANHFTDAYCKQVFYLVGKYLRHFVVDPEDVEAATGMLQASSMGAMAFNTARLGLVHGMASPLGIRFHLSHGESCAVLMPPVIRYNLLACPERFVDIAVGLEGTVAGSLLMDRAHCAIEAIERLMEDIGIVREFDSQSLSEEELGLMADETLASGYNLTNPRNSTKDDVLRIFQDLLGKNE